MLTLLCTVVEPSWSGISKNFFFYRRPRRSDTLQILEKKCINAANTCGMKACHCLLFNSKSILNPEIIIYEKCFPLQVPKLAENILFNIFYLFITKSGLKVCFNLPLTLFWLASASCVWSRIGLVWKHYPMIMFWCT